MTGNEKLRQPKTGTTLKGLGIEQSKPESPESASRSLKGRNPEAAVQGFGALGFSGLWFGAV